MSGFLGEGWIPGCLGQREGRQPGPVGGCLPTLTVSCSHTLPGPTFFNTLALYRLAAFAFRNMSCSSSTALACRSGLREGV